MQKSRNQVLPKMKLQLGMKVDVSKKSLSADIYIAKSRVNAGIKISKIPCKCNLLDKDKDKVKDSFIGPQEFVVGYSKSPEQPQSSARPICHSHTMTSMEA